jgi:hypothetical protein
MLPNVVCRGSREIPTPRPAILFLADRTREAMRVFAPTDASWMRQYTPPNPVAEAWALVVMTCEDDYRPFAFTRDEAVAGFLSGASGNYLSYVWEAIVGWEAMPSHKRGSLLGYIKRGVRNGRKEGFRECNKYSRACDCLKDHVRSRGVVTEDESQALREAIGKLPQRLRRAVEMRYFDEATKAEIGDALGVSEKHAARILDQAERRLRELLDA